MRHILFLLLFCSILPGVLPAQDADSTFTPATPPLSSVRMALHYYNIGWTDEQWSELAGSRVELIYLIDNIGEPFLQSSRGLPSQVYFDSLALATRRLPYFTPAQSGGDYVESIYSLYFTFPSYPVTNLDDTTLVYLPFRTVSREELAEQYVKDYNAVFIDFNLNFINHLAGPADYLKPGGGFDMYLGGMWKPRWGAALALGTEFNAKHQPFPEDPLPGRDDQATGVWVGGLVNYNPLMTDRSLLSVRAELGYGVLNAAARLQPNEDEGWVQYRGVHTGVHLNYALRFSRYTPNPGMVAEHVTARYSALNFTAGVRYRYYGNKEGTGAYLFLGVGYRLGRDDFRRR